MPAVFLCTVLDPQTSRVISSVSWGAAGIHVSYDD